MAGRAPPSGCAEADPEAAGPAGEAAAGAARGGALPPHAVTAATAARTQSLDRTGQDASATAAATPLCSCPVPISGAKNGA
jgi:hypothetical protein